MEAAGVTILLIGAVLYGAAYVMVGYFIPVAEKMFVVGRVLTLVGAGVWLVSFL